MELSEKKVEQLNKQPIVETSIRRSEDGKWVVHFEKLPLARTEKDLNDLLPQNTDPDSITIIS